MPSLVFPLRTSYVCQQTFAAVLAVVIISAFASHLFRPVYLSCVGFLDGSSEQHINAVGLINLVNILVEIVLISIYMALS
jgi:hypothetical protein